MMQGAFTELRLRDEDAVGVLPHRAAGLAVAGDAAAPVAELVPIHTGARPSGSLVSGVAFDRKLLAAADIAATALALVAVLAVFGKGTGAAVAALASVPVVLSLFTLSGLYAREEARLAPATLDEAPRLLQVTGLLALAFAILEPAALSRGLSGGQIAALWMAAFVAVMSGRVLARWLAGRIRGVERCLVVGDPEQAARIRERLAESHGRARVVACLPLSSDDLEGVDSASFADDLVRGLQVQRLIVVPALTDTDGGVALIRMAKAAGVKVSVTAQMFDAIGADVEHDEVNGLTLLGVRRFGLSRPSRLLKRGFDLGVGSIGLLAVSPIIGAIALAIRLDSPGPVFFRQVRVGRDGEHFQMIKFRSMVVGADTLKDELRALSEPGDGLFKIADDPRVTRVGSFLRRSSLDELPQIFNVLRGDMSLVGPRPLVIEEDAKIVGTARSRLHLTPGMTGPWQVLSLRVPLHEMVQIDYRYVANWSLWLDLKLLLRTVSHVVRRGNL